MPQPINTNTTSKPRRAVLTRPLCAIEIAAIVGEWAYVEDVLTLMFSAAMGSHITREDGGNNVTQNWVAKIAMQELESIHTRLKIIDKTLAPLLPPALQASWQILEKALRSRAKDRNLVAHASWALVDEFPDDLILEIAGGKYARYTQKDFKDILDRISEVYIETYNFMEAVLSAQRNGTVQIPRH